MIAKLMGMGSTSYDWLVSNTPRLVRFLAHTLAPVSLIVGIVAFEPDHLTVAFEGEDVQHDRETSGRG